MTLKIARFAPIPRARVTTAVAVNPGRRARRRAWCDTACAIRCMLCSSGPFSSGIWKFRARALGPQGSPKAGRSASACGIAHARIGRLRSEIPLERRGGSGDGPSAARCGVGGRERLRAGDVRWLSLAYTDDDPAVVPPFGDEARRKLQSTLDWWAAWAADCRFAGPHREAVVRSLVTLKLLTYAPSGAVIAAPTTSLPEEILGYGPEGV